MAERKTATAKVEKIDKANRRLELKDNRGKQFTVTVPEGVSGFDQIKKGDTISVDYYESVGLALQKSAKGARPSREETTMMERGGTLPGGFVAHRITETARVEKVDRTNNQLTLKGPRGEVNTIDVTDPQLQANLSQLKKGDHVQASYTEAVAISVQRPEKGKKSS